MMIQHSLARIHEKIIAAAMQCHREPSTIALLAISKKQSAEKIRDAFYAGQKSFGENYLQEALAKQKQLSDLPIEWHFVGTVQSNKIKMIATHFDWVHSVNQFSVAEKLNRARASQQKPLNICIEVNIDEEKTKSGVWPSAVVDLAKSMVTFPYLRLRGLMVIPQKNNARDAFQKTAQLQQQLIAEGLLVDTLSMGMSADFELAIAAGSTLIRIGTAIFGERIQL